MPPIERLSEVLEVIKTLPRHPSQPLSVGLSMQDQHLLIEHEAMAVKIPWSGEWEHPVSLDPIQLSRAIQSVRADSISLQEGLVVLSGIGSSIKMNVLAESPRFQKPPAEVDLWLELPELSRVALFANRNTPIHPGNAVVLDPIHAYAFSTDNLCLAKIPLQLEARREDLERIVLPIGYLGLLDWLAAQSKGERIAVKVAGGIAHFSSSNAWASIPLSSVNIVPHKAILNLLQLPAKARVRADFPALRGAVRVVSDLLFPFLNLYFENTLRVFAGGSGSFERFESIIEAEVEGDCRVMLHPKRFQALLDAAQQAEFIITEDPQILVLSGKEGWVGLLSAMVRD